MSAPKILRLTGDRELRRAHVLAEFEGIVIDPRFAPLFGYADHIEPGSAINADDPRTVLVPEAEFEKRGKELTTFLDLRGIAVIYGYAETIIVGEQRRLTESPPLASTHQWFVERLQPPPRRLKPGERVPFPSDEPSESWLRAGRGEQVYVVEPGHAFAPYLENVGGYRALFTRSVREWSNATILAENRAGEPVGVEFAAGRGSILIVPPPPDAARRDQLIDALIQLLRERVGLGREWPLAIEEALDAEEHALALRHRGERIELANRRAEVQRVKALLLADTIAKRVIAYWDRVTAAGATHEQALQQLYKLIEVLEDRYDGERGLPAALSIDKGKLRAVKRLANSYDIRHANSDPEALPSRFSTRLSRSDAI